jgi:hypothetical protein
MAQTSIAAPLSGIEGNLSRNHVSTRIVARIAEGTIPFGRVVKQGSADDGAALPSSAADCFVGLSMQDPTKEAGTDGTRKFVQYDEMPVLEDGEAWVLPEETVAPNDPVYVRIAAGGSGQTVGRVRKSADETVAVKRQQTLTLSGALDGGRRRVQKIVLSADLVAADQVDGKIGGTAIAAITYGGSHAATMAEIVNAIEQAAETAGAQMLEVSIKGATKREIHIFSADVGATTAPLVDWAVTHGGGGTAVFAAATGADVTAGKEPHGLSIELDGGAALVQDWAGTGDATLRAFAELLAAQPAIDSAVVTAASDTGGGQDDAERVITVVAAVGSPTANAFTNPTVSGGVNARTLVVAETVAGVAAVVAKAVLWPNARFKSTGGVATLTKMAVAVL